MTEIKPKRDPWDFPVNADKVTYQGVDYNFRELTVAETDMCREGAMSDKDGVQVFDGRLMTRLMVVTAATEPEMDLEKLSLLPQRLYAAIVEKVNELNDPDALNPKKDEDPGKS